MPPSFPDLRSSSKLCSSYLDTNTPLDSSDDPASHISLHVRVDQRGFKTKNPSSEQAGKLGFGETWIKLVEHNDCILELTYWLQYTP